MTEDQLKKPLIYIAEDEYPIAMTLKQFLEASGFTVIHAADGALLLEKISEKVPDVILLDVRMPNMDGYETCRRIRALPALKAIPVLMLTALDQPAEKVRGLNIGADDYISKPFNYPELLARVKAFLRTKQLHDQLDESYKKLQDLERLRDALTSMIIHDLKAPITSIYGSMMLILEELESDGTKFIGAANLLKNGSVACMQLTDLINNILDVSKLEEKGIIPNRVEVDLERTVKGCFDTLKIASQTYRVGLELKTQGGDFKVNCDEMLVRRTFMNLINNAIKYTGTDGKITVYLNRKSRIMECVVEDNGRGIPPEYREKIFQKFFQIKTDDRVSEGQGMGLAFCKIAIEAHGGRIWVESEIKKGSRFIFELPLD